eukprot:g1279.t1
MWCASFVQETEGGGGGNEVGYEPFARPWVVQYATDEGGNNAFDYEGKEFASGGMQMGGVQDYADYMNQYAGEWVPEESIDQKHQADGHKDAEQKGGDQKGRHQKDRHPKTGHEKADHQQGGHQKAHHQKEDHHQDSDEQNSKASAAVPGPDKTHMAHAKGQKEGQKAVQKASEKDHKHTKDKKAAQAVTLLDTSEAQGMRSKVKDEVYAAWTMNKHLPAQEQTHEQKQLGESMSRLWKVTREPLNTNRQELEDAGRAASTAITRLRTAELQQLRKSAKTAQEKLMKAGTPRDKADAPNQTAAQGAKDWSEMLQRDARKQDSKKLVEEARQAGVELERSLTKALESRTENRAQDRYGHRVSLVTIDDLVPVWTMRYWLRQRGPMDEWLYTLGGVLSEAVDVAKMARAPQFTVEETKPQKETLEVKVEETILPERQTKTFTAEKLKGVFGSWLLLGITIAGLLKLAGVLLGGFHAVLGLVLSDTQEVRFCQEAATAPHFHCSALQEQSHRARVQAVGSLACLDDRIDEPVLATPGGELGEFTVALAAYMQEKASNGSPSQEVVDSLFSNYLETVPKSRTIALCTDQKALQRLAAELSTGNLDLQDWQHFGSHFSQLQLRVLRGEADPQAFLEVSCQKCGGLPALTPSEGPWSFCAPKLRGDRGPALVSQLDAPLARRDELASFFAKASRSTPQKVKASSARDPTVSELVRRLQGKALDEIKLPEDAKLPGRRCLNPMAAVIDALRYPDGDGHGDSMLRYGQLKPLMPHVIIGAGPPGGSWQSMSPSTVTLSPGSWMDLPGHSLADHLRGELASDEAHELHRYYGSSEALAAARVPRWLVAEYYSTYARRLTSTEFDADSECKTIKAKAVALATGTADVPRRLNITGEDLDFVTHRPPIHNQALMARIGHLLVVGAGLSAADAILHALGLRADGINVRVTHVFRGKAEDTKIGKMFGDSHGASMYRDEEWLAQLMRQKASDPRYTAKAESDLQEILEDGSCVIKRKEGEETISEAAWFCKSMQEPLSENKQFRGYFALLAS